MMLSTFLHDIDEYYRSGNSPLADATDEYKLNRGRDFDDLFKKHNEALWLTYGEVALLAPSLSEECELVMGLCRTTSMFAAGQDKSYEDYFAYTQESIEKLRADMTRNLGVTGPPLRDE